MSFASKATVCESLPTRPIYEKDERRYLIFVLIRWAERHKKSPEYHHLLALPKIPWEKHKDKKGRQMTSAQKTVRLNKP